MSWLKTQLHLHVKGDPIDKIKYEASELIWRAKQLNYNVLSITCHDKLIFRKKDQQLAHQNNILLLPGIEKTIQKKHVLIINAHPESEFINSFDDLRIYKKDHKHSLIIAPHPFHKLSNCLGSKLVKHHELFDAIELSWFNSSILNFNRKAEKIANKLNKPLIATADVHFLDALEFGYCFVKPRINSVEGIVEAIKNGMISNYLKPMSTLALFKNFRRLEKEIK